MKMTRGDFMRGAFAAAAYGVLGRGFGFAQTAGMPGRPLSSLGTAGKAIKANCNIS